MIELILSYLGKALAPLIAAGGALLIILLQRWRVKRLQEQNAEKDRVITGYKKIEEVHKQDTSTDASTQKKIDKIEDEVHDAETPEQAAEKVSGAINDYFNGERK